MNKKLMELRQNLTKKLEEAKEFADQGNLEEGEKTLEEIRTLKKEIRMAEEIAKAEEEITDTEEVEEVKEEVTETRSKLDQRAVLQKALCKKQLTKEERGLLKEGDATAPDVSAGYIVPEDVRTEINEYKRSYESLKELVDVQSTSTPAGSFVYEELSTLEPLIDLSEGELITEVNPPKFAKKEYKVKDKGGLLPITNQLLADEKGGLFSYIGKWFSRKAVLSENIDILTEIKGASAIKTIKSFKALKKEINTGLDPIIRNGSTLIVNQDGLNFLDSLEDNNGRPLLQPNPSDATKKLFMGYPVKELANATYETPADGVEIIFGNLEEGIKFIEREGYEIATSSEAGFKQNITYLRVLQRYDVIVKDKDSFKVLKLDFTPEPETPETP